MASRMSKKTGQVRSKSTRLIVVIAIVVILVVVGIVVGRSSHGSSDVTLHIITWDETTLSTLKGTPVVLNFWATTCPHCVVELSYFEAVAQESEGEIKVIAIDVGESASSIQSVLQSIFDYEPTMAVALDKNGEVFVNYSQEDNSRWYIPFTVFVDGEGIVQYIKIGAFQSETELWETLDSVFEL